MWSGFSVHAKGKEQKTKLLSPLCLSSFASLRENISDYTQRRANSRKGDGSENNFLSPLRVRSLGGLCVKKHSELTQRGSKLYCYPSACIVAFND
jgi:hypothetical protein